ncbi:hypothetical protein [Azospirillum argentinense]
MPSKRSSPEDSNGGCLPTGRQHYPFGEVGLRLCQVEF